MRKLYSTVYKSALRAVNDLIKDIRATVRDQDIRYWSWEDRMDEDKMPRQPLLGINGFSFEENRGQWIVRFGVTLSTVDDANLMNEADIIDMILEVFGEKKKIPVFNLDDGSVVNELVSVQCQVMPMGQTQLRNYRSLGIELRRTGT